MWQMSASTAHVSAASTARATIERPSGRNLRPKSSLRPRITSRSMSKRMRFEFSMHLA
jgi:hypothetical protein